MTYGFDTGAVVAILRIRPTTVRGRLRLAKSAGAPIGITSIVLFELWYGVARSKRWRENAERLRVFLSGGIAVVPFDKEAAAIAGDLRADLEATGTPIGPFDMLIVAHTDSG